MPNRNARVIIPFVIVTWLISLAIAREGTPAWLEVVFVIAVLVAIPIMVFYLMAEMGWSTLAEHHRTKEPFAGPWQTCAAGRTSRVSQEHPDYQKNSLRMASALRVGVNERALHLSLPFSKIPLVGGFFPEIEVPWSAVASARAYEAQGRFRSDAPGALLRWSYDPNYTGTFIELEIGKPPVFLQLPAGILGDATSRLPPASTTSSRGHHRA